MKTRKGKLREIGGRKATGLRAIDLMPKFAGLSTMLNLK